MTINLENFAPARTGLPSRIGNTLNRKAAKFLGLALISGLGLALAASEASAASSTFAVFTPTDNTTNVSLTGLSLTANDVVRFRFTDPALASLGVISAQWTMTATETSAAAFGPYEVATFNGHFAYDYIGPDVVTAGGHTVHAGDNLLTGSFADGIFAGSGSAASLNASSMASTNVVFSSSLLNFDPAGEEGIAMSFTSIVPPTTVINPGQLADFTAVASGNFAGVSAAPEPAAWSLMIIGVGGIGSTLRSRRRSRAAA